MSGKPAGMGEKGQAEYTYREYKPFERVKLGEAGRLVIPAALRREMGVEPGDDLLLQVEAGELRVIGRLQAIRRAQAEAQQLKKPGESVVDELIAEREAEAAREAGEYR
jgi:AbrB family looped-hinge helix DNA binding protein